LEGSRPGPIAFLPGGKALVALDHEDLTLRLWDASTGRLRDTSQLGRNGLLDRPVVSPDRRTIALAGEESAAFFGRIDLIETDGTSFLPRIAAAD
jgi:hypothetical protein